MSRAWNSISLGMKTPALLLLLVWVLLVGGSSVGFADPNPCTNCACTGIRQDCKGCVLTYLQDTLDGRAIMVNVNPNYYSVCETLPPDFPSDNNVCTTSPIQCLLTDRTVSIASWNTPTDCSGRPTGASEINAFVKKPGCDGNSSP